MAVNDIGKKVIFDKTSGGLGNKLTGTFQVNYVTLVWISHVSIGKPIIETSKNSLSTVIYPSECRERGMSYKSYKSKMQAKLCWRINDGPVETEIKSLGSLPILVRVFMYCFILILVY